MNATSITIDSVEPLPLSEGRVDVSFVVRWGPAVLTTFSRTNHSRKLASQRAKGEGWTLSRDGSGSPFGRHLDQGH